MVIVKIFKKLQDMEYVCDRGHDYWTQSDHGRKCNGWEGIKYDRNENKKSLKWLQMKIEDSNISKIKLDSQSKLFFYFLYKKNPNRINISGINSLIKISIKNKQI